MLSGPPALGSAQYLRDLAETQTMGSRTSAARTPDQTNGAWLWASGSGGIAVECRRAAAHRGSRSRSRSRFGSRRPLSRRASAARGDRDRLLENARILAALNVAMADAAIGCWDQKVKCTLLAADHGDPRERRSNVDAALRDAGAPGLPIRPLVRQRRGDRDPRRRIRRENALSR